MSQRIDYAKQAPELVRKMMDLSAAVKNGSIEQNTLTLVDIRASQLNGCAFCLDMHVKEARIHGERDLRVHHVAIWRESPLFNARERAALAWTEAVTRLGEGGVPDAVYAEVREAFSEKEIVDLNFAVMTINAWNRLAIAFQAVPGSADKLYGLEKANLA
ncbi:carboxymuconolactone decarboxylase family protein [Novosphingobium sp. PhB55]|jgi:AhpD family alkylhydroperoxidase|uniref:carboxymuconolactone decarboxylase family protein n=1 Tax=unclassified Novosphingobium TaxID=2644732 RepID=UPI001066AC2C|nr:carboxymuconolactone decarboxylase family protein [Novosphingobium sp. PhB55]TDW61712.1 AhpD family alkylhydroperoxidase [Novosphingobium sp. PhB55]